MNPLPTFIRIGGFSLLWALMLTHSTTVAMFVTPLALSAFGTVFPLKNSCFSLRKLFRWALQTAFFESTIILFFIAWFMGLSTSYWLFLISCICSMTWLLATRLSVPSSTKRSIFSDLFVYAAAWINFASVVWIFKLSLDLPRLNTSIESISPTQLRTRLWVVLAVSCTLCARWIAIRIVHRVSQHRNLCPRIVFFVFILWFATFLFCNAHLQMLLWVECSLLLFLVVWLILREAHQKTYDYMRVFIPIMYCFVLFTAFGIGAFLTR